MVEYPSLIDYDDIVTNYPDYFYTQEIIDGRPLRNKSGDLLSSSGQFACVFKWQNKQRKPFAVRCFLINTEDRCDKYRSIARYIGKKDPTRRYFANFQYHEKGFYYNDRDYPIVTMDWIEGSHFDRFLGKNLREKVTLRQLLENWVELIIWLRKSKIAHGDLANDNILVLDDTSLKLIDYDPMFIPKFTGGKCEEIGKPDFQHPQRKGNDFNAALDNFSTLVFFISISALMLSKQPNELWQKYHKEDNLLFRKDDFLDPTNSDLFLELYQLEGSNEPLQVKGLEPSITLKMLLQKLEDYCLAPHPPQSDWLDSGKECSICGTLLAIHTEICPNCGELQDLIYEVDIGDGIIASSEEQLIGTGNTYLEWKKIVHEDEFYEEVAQTTNKIKNLHEKINSVSYDLSLLDTKMKQWITRIDTISDALANAFERLETCEESVATIASSVRLHHHDEHSKHRNVSLLFAAISCIIPFILVLVVTLESSKGIDKNLWVLFTEICFCVASIIMAIAALIRDNKNSAVMVLSVMGIATSIALCIYWSLGF